ncbi:cytochrome c oxidase, subunit VIa [Pilobolus umbonatus]|nr:cytochrome c oxidase, subunit VIa [Pilobolus umbonatus]
MYARLTSQVGRNLNRLGVRYNSNLAANEFLAEREAVKHHAGDAAATWKKISIFVCIPALAAASFNAYQIYSHHVEHAKHHPKEWIKYPYINTRGKDFFWGKESLFFNPKVNLSASE